MPLISVIVPVYNVEEYIRECIESVLNQTFEDYELILVDDGSPDRCGLICDEYAKRDKRIRVIHKENSGVSNARNAGLDAACGKYVYFMDSDDYIVPDLLEKAVNHMETGLDMLVFNFWEKHENGEELPNIFPEYGEFSIHTSEERLAFLKYKLLAYKINWAPWNRVFVREIIEKNHLRFEDYRKIIAEDLYFSFCYCAHISNILVIEDRLYIYRLRGNSLMASQKTRINIGRYNELSKALLAYITQFESCDLLLKNYCMIHYMIMAGPIVEEYVQSGLSAPEFREKVKEAVSDWDFFALQMEKYLTGWNRHKTGIHRFVYLEQLCYVKYLLDGAYTALRVRIKLLYFFRPLLDSRMSKISKTV